MALIESELQTYLEGLADITAIASTRIYPGKKPIDGSYPCITYVKISSPRIRYMDGATGMVQARMQFNCWAERYSVVAQLADELRKELDNFSGTIGTTQIDAIALEAESDIFNKELITENQIAYGRRLDFQVRYRETVDDNT